MNEVRKLEANGRRALFDYGRGIGGPEVLVEYRAKHSGEADCEEAIAQAEEARAEWEAQQEELAASALGGSAEAFFISPETRQYDTSQPFRVRFRTWDEVVVPRGASKIEALTYVPGLVGAIVDWIVAGAPRPSRVMALAVALGVVGTLIGRRVEGPRGQATHLMIFVLAPSAWGKDWPLWCGKKLMIAAGWQELLGPGDFVSGVGLIKFLKRTPLLICFVDELGDLFQLINGQDNNPWVRDLIGHFKELYASWSLMITAESAYHKSVTINHPAFTMIGFGTPESFFETLSSRDIESGFANRPMYFPFDGFKRPPEQDVPKGMEEPPEELVEALKRLRPRREKGPILDQKDNDELAPPVSAADRLVIDWGSEGAKAVYFAFSQEIDGYEEKDKRKFAVGRRAAENALRCATILAAGRQSKTVDVEDIEWAVKWSRISLEAACGGFEKYVFDYFTFPKFCAEVFETLRLAGGWLSHRDLKRHFRAHMRRGDEFQRALEQLLSEERIRKAKRKPDRGPEAVGYEILLEELGGSK